MRIDRERYFKALSYLESSVLFAGPAKPSAMAKWAESAPAGSLGLVAPFVLTHRKPPASQGAQWPHDATTGEFRDSPLARSAVGPLADAAKQVTARSIVFKSPELFSASAANRAALQQFFADVVPAETFACERVWLPGGLWEVRAAVKFARELGVTLAFDPTVRAPEEPPEIYYDLDAPSLYFRVENAGRAGAMRQESIEELAVLIEHYAGTTMTVAFASSERWTDARNLVKLLGDS